MKPLPEGVRVYSRRAPVRELRPPKVSVPKHLRPDVGTKHRPVLWLILSVLAAFAGCVALVS